jgi:hypothetical protein
MSDFVDRLLGQRDPAALRPRLPSLFEPGLELREPLPAGSEPTPASTATDESAPGPVLEPVPAAHPVRARPVDPPIEAVPAPPAVPQVPAATGGRPAPPAAAVEPPRAAARAPRQAGRPDRSAAAGSPQAPPSARLRSSAPPAPAGSSGRAVDRRIIPARPLDGSSGAPPPPQSRSPDASSPARRDRSSRRPPVDEEPTVQIAIGRIEIRATALPATPPRRARTPLPTLGLDDYLRERERGGRG